MRSSWAFLTGVFFASLPFYVWGLVWPMTLPLGMPISARMIVVPAGLAVLLSEDPAGLWRGLGDLGRAPLGWTMCAMALVPVATALARLWAGWPVTPLPWSGLPLMLALYVPGAALEELGWTGFLTPRLQARLGVARAGLIIGAAWALWHVVPWFRGQGHSVVWLSGQIAMTVLMRLIMGVVYVRAGQSLALATLIHAAMNLAYSVAPNAAASYDPVRLALILLPVAALALWAGREI